MVQTVCGGGRKEATFRALGVDYRVILKIDLKGIGCEGLD